MGKFRAEKLSESERTELLREFYDALSCLKNRDEVKMFFRDLLTFDEMIMLIRRIQVALLLRAGYTYRDIEQALDVGGDKVTNVSRSLQRHGEGYRLIIARLRKKIKTRERETKRRQRRAQASFPNLQFIKNKYPAHFFLFNLIDEIGDALDDDGTLQREKNIDMRKGKKN
jgi:TrpR-related protein YerC/YecD